MIAKVTPRPATPEQLEYRAKRFNLCTCCRNRPRAAGHYLCPECRDSKGNEALNEILTSRKLSGRPWRRMVPGGVDYDTAAERDMDKEP